MAEPFASAAPRTSAGAAVARGAGTGGESLPASDGGAGAARAGHPVVTGCPATAGEARRLVLALVGGHAPGARPDGPAVLDEPAVIDLLLVTSELVTNALTHGGGVTSFEAAVVPDGVRLTVCDRSEALPAARGRGGFPRPHLGGGYGWPLIVRLAREISVTRLPEGGKAVRALVPTR
ncbi:ATP-binding protein [Streptomyces sp. NPDC005955]|uniref:ATP-binding protein n=1 Tax=Streptomyces sp. NPDC005955 TaxID=3364738 RepID=UPI003675086A